jgi:hypothetical protein
VVIARDLDEPALLARALTACGYITGYFDAETARAYMAEALGLARALQVARVAQEHRMSGSGIDAVAQGAPLLGHPLPLLAPRGAARPGRCYVTRRRMSTASRAERQGTAQRARTLRSSLHDLKYDGRSLQRDLPSAGALVGAITEAIAVCDRASRKPTTRSTAASSRVLGR